MVTSALFMISIGTVSKTSKEIIEVITKVDPKEFYFKHGCMVRMHNLSSNFYEKTSPEKFMGQKITSLINTSNLAL